jgi:hypothetical protein
MALIRRLHPNAAVPGRLLQRLWLKIIENGHFIFARDMNPTRII